MTRALLLGEKAHCRFGDKGDTGLFVVVPYVASDFAPLVSILTPAALSRHFGNLPAEQITVTPCSALGAIVIAMRNSLGGGVTRALALDIHGKTRSGYLLGMPVDWPER
jgi:hypothetical protein